MENFIKDLKENVSYNPLQVVWGSYVFSPVSLGHSLDGIRDFLYHTWGGIEHQAALNIFEAIKDGGRYVVQAEKFCRQAGRDYEPGYLDTLIARQPRYDYPSYFPEITIGYRGYLSQVQTLHYQYMDPPETYTMPLYRPPSWREIAQGIKKRVEEDVTIPNAWHFFARHILARILYLPELNPHFWGYPEGYNEDKS